jgi:hypothetical protein
MSLSGAPAHLVRGRQVSGQQIATQIPTTERAIGGILLSAALPCQVKLRTEPISRIRSATLSPVEVTGVTLFAKTYHDSRFGVNRAVISITRR